MASIIFLKAMIDFYVIRISLWRLKRKLTNAFKAEQLAATRVVGTLIEPLDSPTERPGLAFDPRLRRVQ